MKLHYEHSVNRNPVFTNFVNMIDSTCTSTHFVLEINTTFIVYNHNTCTTRSFHIQIDL